MLLPANDVMRVSRARSVFCMAILDLKAKSFIAAAFPFCLSKRSAIGRSVAASCGISHNLERALPKFRSKDRRADH